MEAIKLKYNLANRGRWRGTLILLGTGIGFWGSVSAFAANPFLPLPKNRNCVNCQAGAVSVLNPSVEQTLDLGKLLHQRVAPHLQTNPAGSTTISPPAGQSSLYPLVYLKRDPLLETGPDGRPLWAANGANWDGYSQALPGDPPRIPTNSLATLNSNFELPRRPMVFPIYRRF